MKYYWAAYCVVKCPLPDRLAILRRGTISGHNSAMYTWNILCFRCQSSSVLDVRWTFQNLKPIFRGDVSDFETCFKWGVSDFETYFYRDHFKFLNLLSREDISDFETCLQGEAFQIVKPTFRV